MKKTYVEPTGLDAIVKSSQMSKYASLGVRFNLPKFSPNLVFPGSNTSRLNPRYQLLYCSPQKMNHDDIISSYTAHLQKMNHDDKL